MARDYKGIGNQDMSAVGIIVDGFIGGHRKNHGDDRNRVLNENGISTTLTATDYKDPIKITVLVDIKSDVVCPVLTPDRAEKRQNGRRFKENGEEMFILTAQDRHGVAVGIETEIPENHPGIYVELPDGCVVYAVWYKKYECYIAIRKLTPRECFRLQGWSDDYFEKAEFVNSDSQLFKQAGNGATTTVVYDIAKAIAELKKGVTE